MKSRFATLLGLTLAGVLLASSPAKSAPGGGGGAGGNIYYQLDFTPVWTDTNQSIDAYGGSLSSGRINTYATRGFDLKNTFGYAWDGMWLVGFSYNILSTSGKRDSASSGETAIDNKTSRSEYGPTVGVLYEGWRATLTYLLFSEHKIAEKRTNFDGTVSSDTEVTNKKGSGFLLNIGYSFSLTPLIQIGPSLVLRQVQYGARKTVDKQTPGNNGESDYSTKAFETTFDPYFSVTFRF